VLIRGNFRQREWFSQDLRGSNSGQRSGWRFARCLRLPRRRSGSAAATWPRQSRRFRPRQRRGKPGDLLRQPVGMSGDEIEQLPGENRIERCSVPRRDALELDDFQPRDPHPRARPAGAAQESHRSGRRRAPTRPPPDPRSPSRMRRARPTVERARRPFRAARSRRHRSSRAVSFASFRAALPPRGRHTSAWARETDRECDRLEEAQGLSQQQLADSAGVSLRYVGALEAGDNSPSLTAIFQLCDALRTSPAELLEEPWRQRR
jgi:DNA-binding XRE family transcriptional regulator